MFKPIRLIPVLLASLLFASCSDDDKDITPDNEIPSEFSELTVEQNKENLENNGLELIGDLRQLKDAPGIETTVSFNHFLSVADLPETGRKVTTLQPMDLIRALASFGQGKTTAAQVLTSFRSKETDPESAQEIFDTYEGVFNYDAGAGTWTHTAADDGKIVFNFPSTEEGTTNNAQFSIYGYSSVQIQNTEAEYTGDAPTALKADLTVNSAKQISYEFTASYKSNGEPTSVVSSLTIGAFKFTMKVANNSQEASVDYSLLRGDKNVISLGTGATGNFTSATIDQSEGVGSVVTTANAYFQLVNIRFAAEINVKGLDNALANDLTAEQKGDAWNANATMVVFYADSKKKIADTEFYGTEESETYSYCWDQNGDGIDECEEYVEIDENLEVRLIFADGSKSDLATYTDVGFEEIESEIENFINELEADLD